MYLYVAGKAGGGRFGLIGVILRHTAKRDRGRESLAGQLFLNSIDRLVSLSLSLSAGLFLEVDSCFLLIHYIRKGLFLFSFLLF